MFRRHVKVTLQPMRGSIIVCFVGLSRWTSYSDDEPAAAPNASPVLAPPSDHELHRMRMAAHAQKGAEKAGRVNALVVSGKDAPDARCSAVKPFESSDFRQAKSAEILQQLTEFQEKLEAGTIDRELDVPKWKSLEEQIPALIWAPDAPYSPLMEQVGYEERGQLKRSRASARALKLGIATVDPAPWMSMFKAMADAEAFPSRDGALGSRFTQLLTSQMASHGRTRRAAILDALFFFCSGSYLNGQDQIVYEGWGFPGHEEGRHTFCYDSFEGGSGYDNLFIKKADPALYTPRWLTREWKHETQEKLPAMAKEGICEATGGLLFAAEPNPKVERDYATREWWLTKPEWHEYPGESQVQRWRRIADAEEDWDVDD